MQQQQLEEWIRHPERLNGESLYELRDLVACYPYFQTARLLYLKNLYVIKDPSFKEELRKSALYIADPKLLFYSIEGERFIVEKHKSDTAEASADRTLNLIDRFLSGETEQRPTGIVPLQVEEPMDYTAMLLEESPDQEETSEQLPMRGQKWIDDFLGGGEPERASDPMATEAISAEEQGTDKADEEDYLTETLAKIYIKQGRYERAREIIRKLNLKYPKKNAYFADQMRFLDKLIINAKSK